MLSRSCTNFIDLASGSLLNYPQSPTMLPKVMTVPDTFSDEDSDPPSPVSRQKIIMVANYLPIDARKHSKTSKWCFSFDQDSLLLQIKDGFVHGSNVLYIGSLKVEIDGIDQDEVAQTLLDEFNCVPTFLPHDLQKRYYHGFCKQHLWPLLHYMLPMFSDNNNRFDRSLWQAYVSANTIFGDKVMEVINPDDDFVWIHDYHLMILPTLLRRRFNRVRLGFFLHSPFPSSEIYRTLPVRDEILKSLLNADLIGFHTFDYARHFLSCCSRMLGLDYESKRGYIRLDYFGRTVYIKILSVGIHVGRLESTLNLPSTAAKIKEIQEPFKGKKIILGIDDMDIFKGIREKLLAMEQLLKQHIEFRGKIVLIQILNPARSTGNEVQEVKNETCTITRRINDAYGSSGYTPIVLIDRHVPFSEKTAYYVSADCCIVTAVRDGMNLTPYDYIACRQGTLKTDEALGYTLKTPRTSSLVVSEFIGCSPSLSGALRVNPWDIDAISDALNIALTMPDLEKQLRHEKHYRYVSSHDVAYWAQSFMQDLERACKDHYMKRCWGIGFGLNFRIVALSPNFRKLSLDHILGSYKKTNKRAIFLDYDGTLVPKNSNIKSPSPQVIAIINRLCSDPKNTVFLVSGRGKYSLDDWFSDCDDLGIAAEHGYFMRWNKLSEWEKSTTTVDFDWKKIAGPVMRSYTEATDGSSIETKESALVWHHQDADPAFGSCQAKELLDHLENVLANDPVVVKRGQHIVEVLQQGVSKGLVAKKVLSTMIGTGKPPDFVMCIGDDRSDEDMFESISSTSNGPYLPEIFACTVGQKPSKARYYLDDTVDVLKLLHGLSTGSSL